MIPRDALRQTANVVVIPSAIALQYVTGAGKRVGDISRQTEPMLAAAGWAFAIWGLIFAGWLAYAVYQLLPAQRHRPLHRRVGWLTTATAALATGWTYAFAQQAFGAAWVAMLALLAVLVALEAQLGRIERADEPLPDRVIVRWTYGLNLGWVTVAAVLNTAQVLGVHGYHGQPCSAEAWSIALVMIGVLAGVLLVLRRHDHAAALGIAWGLVGVFAYRQRTAPTLAIVAVTAAVVLVALVYADRRIRLPRPPAGPREQRAVG